MVIAHSMTGGDPNRMAAMVATALGLGKRMCETFGAGQLSETSVSGDQGLVFIYAAGTKGVLAVQAPSGGTWVCCTWKRVPPPSGSRRSSAEHPVIPRANHLLPPFLMSVRPELGDFSSIVCFKALITGVEDTLGTEGAAAVFVQAGRLRGVKLANDLGLAGTKPPIEALAAALNNAVGKEGTRLCRIDSARELPNGVIQVDTAETVCSAGEAMGSQRQCTFTLGAVAAAIETVMSQRYTARQVGSVLRGGTHDTFEFTPAVF